jgi:sigma-E factor negative regulatory protein RseB
VGQLPEGFAKVSHHRFTEASGRHPTEHLVFADGLATISVFLERLEGDPPLLQGESQLGSMNAFGMVVSGHQVLVVGEAPAATVQRIAASIQYAPETGKP